MLYKGLRSSWNGQVLRLPRTDLFAAYAKAAKELQGRYRDHVRGLREPSQRRELQLFLSCRSFYLEGKNAANPAAFFYDMRGFSLPQATPFQRQW